ncbi:FCD domain-containing protein [uncultured Bifidobacterium sp.]|uniref:FadR/GntR family transcriptional regulator n=1 Tax=uncultured Bifidobacterium sp. TaxID=165187 RepID=UPI0028DC1BF4|nr:FCD domain-containing protein [uncultured Bifidobacterium sp.]
MLHKTHDDEDNDKAVTSLHDRLLDYWGMSVVTGGTPAGQRLPQPTVHPAPSRTVTREVTRVLETMGLVTVRRKAGATANPRDGWNPYDPHVIEWRLRSGQRAETLRELTELRAAIEPEAARLAATRATPDQWATLTQAAIDMVAHSADATGGEYLDADIRFHGTLMQASGNCMFAALGNVVASMLIGRTEHNLMPGNADATALRLHGDVAAYVRKGDGANAERAMNDIIREAGSSIETRLS